VLQVGEAVTKQSQQKHDYNSVSGGRSIDNRQWTELSLHLQPFHYMNGQLNLRCTAKIPGIYEQTSEVQLGYGLREPVPERGERHIDGGSLWPLENCRPRALTAKSHGKPHCRTRAPFLSFLRSSPVAMRGRTWPSKPRNGLFDDAPMAMSLKRGGGTA
jgi:hypothetical protein